MDLCSKTHAEICYDAYNCPLCLEVKDREAKEAEIAELKDKIDELNETIKILEED